MKTSTLPMYWVWTALLCLLLHTLSFAQETTADQHTGLLLQIRSQETTEISGKLEVPVRITALQDIDLAGMQLGLQSAPALGGKKHLTALPKRRLKAGEFIQKSIVLSYDPKDLPFHHQRLRIGIKQPKSPKWISITGAYVYFTPYGSAELWNETDFDNLKRTWISRQDKRGQRRKISRKEVPVSNLSNAEFVNDSFPRAYHFVEGLAYAVPMRMTTSKTTKSAKSSNTYSGRISGRIITAIDSDTMPDRDTVALTNIRVDVFNDRGGKIETTWTDEAGEFSIDASAVPLNGDSLELYVEVHGINEEETIRVRGRGLGPTRKEFYLKQTPFTWHYQDGDVHMGDINTDENELKGQLLHWANRARVFVEAELQGAGFSLPDQPGDKLEIMTHPWRQDVGAMFMPAHIEAQLQAGAIVIPFPLNLFGAIWLENILSNKDCLYIGEDSENDDGTVSHEFGHYLMWHMQDEHWAGLFEAGLAVHTSKANNKTGDLAWTEGFANGFSMIMETVNVMEEHAPIWSTGPDHQLFNYDQYSNYEDSIYVIDIGGGATRNDQALTHGFVSEYYIGHLIYDLWDGPLKVNGPSLTSSAYQDIISGPINDSIELSFQEIVQPILDHPGVGGGPGLFGFNQSASVINSIPEYHGRLLFEQPFDCLERKAIHELFNFNKIRNIKDGVWSDFLLDQHRLNLDEISYVAEIETERFQIKEGSPKYKLDGTNLELYTLDVTELPNPESSYNLYAIGPDAGFVQLLDDLKVSGGARLYLNKDDIHGWLDINNHYDQIRAIGTAPPTNFLDVEICGGMTLEVDNGGELILGDPNPNNNKRAELRFAAGSTFILGEDGGLKIYENSRLIIEPGATFIYKKGARILLNTSTSILQIEGEWILDDNAVFDFDGWGFVRTDLPDNNGGANITHRPGSSIALVGEQKEEHKMLEVVAGTHFTTQKDDCNMSVHFEEGIIEMGAGAQIDLTDSRLSMRRAWVREISGSAGRHKGIFVNRAPSMIMETDFEDGTIGLEVVMDTALMNCGTVPGRMIVSASSFRNCGVGLHTRGGSAELGAVVFQNNGTGWRAVLLQGDSQVGRNEASGHGRAAYDLSGERTPHLVSISDSYVIGNRSGILGDNNLELELRCDSIANNQIGIGAGYNVVLSMNDEAYNHAGGNNRTIVLKKARRVDLQDGYNYLETSSSAEVIAGTLLLPPAVNPIPADHNFWEAAAFGAGSVPPSPATVNVWLAGSPGTVYSFSDTAPLGGPVGGPHYCQVFAGGGGPFPGFRLGSDEHTPAVIPHAELGQNIPNPAQQYTRIPYFLPEEAGRAQIRLFDLVTGRVIRQYELTEGDSSEIRIERGNLSAGVYGYSLIVDGQLAATRKLVWMD